MEVNSIEIENICCKEKSNYLGSNHYCNHNNIHNTISKS